MELRTANDILEQGVQLPESSPDGNWNGHGYQPDSTLARESPAPGNVDIRRPQVQTGYDPKSALHSHLM